MLRRGCLPERQAVADDEAVLVEIALEVAARGGVAQLEAKVFQWAALDDVGDVGVALPGLAFAGAGATVDVVTGDVAGHQAQPGNAHGGEVVVVADLPGTLVLVTEIVDLQQVDQRVIATGDVGETGIAAHVLVTAGEGMSAMLVGEQRAEGVVVDVAAAIVGGAHIAQVGLEALRLADRQHMDQAEVVLVVDAVQPTVVVAGGQLWRPVVAPAGEEELVARRIAAKGDVAQPAVEHRHLFVVGRVAVAGAIQHAEIQREAFDVLALQPGAAIDVRQQAAVVTHQHRDHRLQRAHVQRGGGQLGLGGQARRAVVVRRFTGGRAWQQAGATATGAGVELDAEQPDGIQAKADRPFGVAGFHFQDEALGPLLGLGLAVPRTEVAVHVEVAQFDSGLAVFDESGAGGAGGDHYGAAAEGVAEGFVVQSHGVSSCCCFRPLSGGYRA